MQKTKANGASKDNLVLTADLLQKALENNPELLQAALNKMGVAGNGKRAYSVIETREDEVVTYKVSGTRIVPDKPVKIKNYHIKLLNGCSVWVPEHCLSNYGINLQNAPIVDDDGLTEQERRMAIEQGAC